MFDWRMAIKVNRGEYLNIVTSTQSRIALWRSNVHSNLQNVLFLTYKTNLNSNNTNKSEKKQKQVKNLVLSLTHLESSCWPPGRRCSPASPHPGPPGFPDFFLSIPSPPAAPRLRPVSMSCRCHGDPERPRAIRRCQGDSSAGSGWSRRRRGCRKHTGGPGRSAERKKFSGFSTSWSEWRL